VDNVLIATYTCNIPSPECDDLANASVLYCPEVLDEQSIVGQCLLSSEVADARLLQGILRQGKGLAIEPLNRIKHAMMIISMQVTKVYMV
jgi:hypothetical protein